MIDGLVILAIVLMVLLVAAWIFYNRYTKAIIEDLIIENAAKDLKIAALEQELKKYKLRSGEDVKRTTSSN